MNELEKAKLLNASLELAKSEIRKSLKKINFVTEDGEKPKLIIVEQGERGPRGRDGQQGPIGESGLQGPQGERGEQGPQGKRGERGLIGPRGETGPEGPAGPTGPAGRDGRPSDLKPLEDKLKEDLQGFKQQISAQVTRLAMASLNGGGSSGGGEVRLLNLDDVDADVDAAGADGKALVWNNTTKKFILGSVASGGGSGGISNTTFQAFVANTNARITNEGIFNGIIGGSNIRLSFSSGKLMIQSIPQVDFGFITNDAGGIDDPVSERRDFGDLGGRGL